MEEQELTESQKLHQDYSNKCAAEGNIWHDIHITEGRLRNLEKQLEVARDHIRKAAVKYTEALLKEKKLTPETTQTEMPVEASP